MARPGIKQVSHVRFLRSDWFTWDGLRCYVGFLSKCLYKIRKGLFVGTHTAPQIGPLLCLDPPEARAAANTRPQSWLFGAQSLVSVSLHRPRGSLVCSPGNQRRLLLLGVGLSFKHHLATVCRPNAVLEISDRIVSN